MTMHLSKDREASSLKSLRELSRYDALPARTASVSIPERAGKKAATQARLGTGAHGDLFSRWIPTKGGGGPRSRSAPAGPLLSGAGKFKDAAVSSRHSAMDRRPPDYVFRHHSDIAMYMDDYRSTCTCAQQPPGFRRSDSLRPAAYAFEAPLSTQHGEQLGEAPISSEEPSGSADVATAGRMPAAGQGSLVATQPSPADSFGASPSYRLHVMPRQETGKTAVSGLVSRVPAVDVVGTRLVGSTAAFGLPRPGGPDGSGAQLGPARYPAALSGRGTSPPAPLTAAVSGGKLVIGRVILGPHAVHVNGLSHGRGGSAGSILPTAQQTHRLQVTAAAARCLGRGRHVGLMHSSHRHSIEKAEQLQLAELRAEILAKHKEKVWFDESGRAYVRLASRLYGKPS